MHVAWPCDKTLTALLLLRVCNTKNNLKCKCRFAKRVEQYCRGKLTIDLPISDNADRQRNVSEYVPLQTQKGLLANCQASLTFMLLIFGARLNSPHGSETTSATADHFVATHLWRCKTSFIVAKVKYVRLQ